MIESVESFDPQTTRECILTLLSIESDMLRRYCWVACGRVSELKPYSSSPGAGPAPFALQWRTRTSTHANSMHTEYQPSPASGSGAMPNTKAKKRIRSEVSAQTLSCLIARLLHFYPATSNLSAKTRWPGEANGVFLKLSVARTH
jgi:hypothetical protein